MDKPMDTYSTVSVFLLAVAIVLVIVPLFLGFAESLLAVFIIAGLICTILGILVIMVMRSESVDPFPTGLFSVPGSLNLCRIAVDSGITGNAHFLPPEITGETRVMQFNPETVYPGGRVPAGRSFTEVAPIGLVTIPSSDPLMQDLRKRDVFVVPERIEELTVLINEVITEIYDFAPRVTTIWESGSVEITLHDYRFIESCLFVGRSENPPCCTRFPCPVSSLCGTIITECSGKVVTLKQCSASSARDVTAIFMIG